MAVGEPEVDDHERSGRGDQKQRAGGREVVGGDETEIVHVVGECGGLCQLATVSQGIDFFLKRWKPVDGQRAPAIGVRGSGRSIVPEYWSGMLNLRVERVSAPR